MFRFFPLGLACATAQFSPTAAAALNPYELSLLQACESVNDCVIAHKPCDCHNGGGNVGINKGQQAAFEEAISKDFDGHCTMMGGEDPCDEGELRCADKLCRWQWAYAVDPPACQTTEEVLTPSEDAVTAEEMAPFQECVSDLQCISVVNKASCDRNMVGEEVAINIEKRKDFRNAISPPSNMAMGCTAGASEYKWNIGKPECVDGLCQYTPAPHCDDLEDAGPQELEGEGSAAKGNLSHAAVLWAAIVLAASWM